MPCLPGPAPAVQPLSLERRSAAGPTNEWEKGGQKIFMESESWEARHGYDSWIGLVLNLPELLGRTMVAAQESEIFFISTNPLYTACCQKEFIHVVPYLPPTWWGEQELMDHHCRPNQYTVAATPEIIITFESCCLISSHPGEISAQGDERMETCPASIPSPSCFSVAFPPCGAERAKMKTRGAVYEARGSESDGEIYPAHPEAEKEPLWTLSQLHKMKQFEEERFVLTSGPLSRLRCCEYSVKAVSLHLEDTDIHLARGIKEHDFKIALSDQSQGFEIDKPEMGLREYLLVPNVNTTPIDRN
ncbi:hypothetical protein BTVI_11672 [Pitangus sulphuratus]|nr:hypothetical protein BTVI_11672 [Pitangus sulphuratus]